MADQIVVLDGARVVEVGTHEDLLASGKSTLSSMASRLRPIADAFCTCRDMVFGHPLTAKALTRVAGIIGTGTVFALNLDEQRLLAVSLE